MKKSSVENLLKLMSSTLDDDNKLTRLYVCKIIARLLTFYGRALDKDQLHKLYPELIKRLDDHSEEIRIEILKLFGIYVDCLNNNYDQVLYQAQLHVIFENLLLYLDDSSPKIQKRVLGRLHSLLQSDLIF